MNIWDEKLLIYQFFGSKNLQFCDFSKSGDECEEKPDYLIRMDLPEKEGRVWHQSMVAWDVQYLVNRGTKKVYKDLVFVNQDIFVHCHGVNLERDKANLLSKCSKITLRFTKEEKTGIEVSSLEFDPYLTQAIVGYQYDNGGTVSKLDQKDTVYGYVFAEIDQRTTQFKDLTNYQANDIMFLNASYYILNFKELKYLYKRRGNEILIQPPKSKAKYKMKIHAFSDHEEDSNGTNGKEKRASFIIDSIVNTLKSDYEFLQINQVFGTTVYNKGWFDLGLNSKILFGNNAKLEVSLDQHNLPTVSQRTREIDMIADISITDADINSLFLVRAHNIEFGDDFYTESINTGKGVIARVYMMFQEKTGVVNVLECSFNKFEISGNDAEHKYLLKDDHKDQDPTDPDYNWKKGRSVCGRKFKFGKETELKDVSLKSVGSSENYIYIVGKKIENDVSESWLFMIKSSEKESKIFGSVKLLETDALCDMQIYSSNIYTICNYGRGSKGIGQSTNSGIQLNQIKIMKNGIKVARTFTIIPEDNGVPKFKQGLVLFFAGSNKLAYVVNNHPEQPSILVVDFQSMNEGIHASISEIIPIHHKAYTPGTQAFNFEICPTLSNLVIFNPSNGFIYAVNTNAPLNSFLTIPITSADGNERTAEHMRCSDNDEAFQVWLKDKYKNKRILATYYGFDGTQGGKKLHSEVEIEGKVNQMAFTSLLADGDGSLLTFLFDNDSIYYNQTLLINLEGPKTLTKMDGLVPNEYKFRMKLFNKKASQENLATISVIQENEMEGINISPQKITPEKGKTYKVTDFMKLRGDIIQMDVYDESETTQIQIMNPLNLIKTYEYSVDYNIVHIKGDIIVAKKKGENAITIYTEYTKERKLIQLDSYGDNCRYFEIEVFKEGLFLSFVCFKDFLKTLHVLHSPLSKPAEPSQDIFQKVYVEDIGFEIGDIMVSIRGQNLLAVVSERMGRRISVWKMSLDLTKKVSDKITFSWRKPGDNNLYSYCKFGIVELKMSKSKREDDSRYLLTILSPGMNKFDITRLNFKTRSIGYFVVVRLKQHTPFYYLRCKGAETTDFQGDSEVEKMDEPVICIGGGVGVTFEEFFIDMTAGEKSKVSVPEISFKYRLPVLKRYSIDSLKFTSGYILIRGDFGDYLKGNKELPVNTGQSQKKVLPAPEYITPDMVGKLSVMIYKRKREGVLGVGPMGSTASFLHQNGQKQTLSITQVEDNTEKNKKKLLKLKIFEIKDDYYIKFIDELNESVKKFRILLKKVDDSPYNNELTTFTVKKYAGAGHTIFYSFMFGLLIFILAIAIYSYRWSMQINRKNLIYNPEEEKKKRKSWLRNETDQYHSFTDIEADYDPENIDDDSRETLKLRVAVMNHTDTRRASIRLQKMGFISPRKGSKEKEPVDSGLGENNDNNECDENTSRTNSQDGKMIQVEDLGNEIMNDLQDDIRRNEWNNIE